MKAVKVVKVMKMMNMMKMIDLLIKIRFVDQWHRIGKPKLRFLLLGKTLAID